jgi:hypothetical protein
VDCFLSRFFAGLSLPLPPRFFACVHELPPHLALFYFPRECCGLPKQQISIHRQIRSPRSFVYLVPPVKSFNRNDREQASRHPDHAFRKVVSIAILSFQFPVHLGGFSIVKQFLVSVRRFVTPCPPFVPSVVILLVIPTRRSSHHTRSRTGSIYLTLASRQS